MEKRGSAGMSTDFPWKFRSLLDYFGQREPDYGFGRDKDELEDKKESEEDDFYPEKLKIIPRKYTMKEVAHHCDRHSCWIVIMDKVYDVTEYLHEHPGGEDVVLDDAGRDCTISFTEKGHSKDALLLLQQYCIGSLVDADKVVKMKRSMSI